MAHRFPAPLFVSVLVCLSMSPIFLMAASDILITVTPTVVRTSPGAVSARASTSFSDVISAGPNSTGLIDTEGTLRNASSVDLPDYGGAMPSPLSVRGRASSRPSS